MALKQVVADRFFDAMIEILRKIEKERGPLTFAMLELAYRTGPAEWYLSLAAPWLDEMDRKDATEWVEERVRGELGPLSEKYMATRIKRTDDYLIRELAPMLDVRELGTAYGLQSRDLELFHLNDVAILVANPALVRRTPEAIPA